MTLEQLCICTVAEQFMRKVRSTSAHLGLGLCITFHSSPPSDWKSKINSSKPDQEDYIYPYKIKQVCSLVLKTGAIYYLAFIWIDSLPSFKTVLFFFFPPSITQRHVISTRPLVISTEECELTLPKIASIVTKEWMIMGQQPSLHLFSLLVYKYLSSQHFLAEV